VSADNRHDEQTDRLIAAALRSGLSPAGPCPDAEAIAAWADGRLDASARQAIEAHAAGCERCLGVLAALAVTDAPAPATVHAFPAKVAASSRPMRWIVPAAAGLAAAGLVAVFVWPNLRDVRSGPEAVALDALATPAAPIPEPTDQQARQSESVMTPPARQERAPVPASSPAAGSLATQKSEAANRGAAAEARPPTPPPALAGQAASGLPLPTAQTGSGAAARVVLPAPPPPAAAPPATARPTPAPTPTPSAAVTQAAAADTTLARADRNALKMVTAAPKFPIEFGPLTGAGAGGMGRGGGRSAAARAMVTTRPELARIRWRILENGRVERSLTGGADWAAVPLEPLVFVTAGSAPSPSVCWLVGREGLVLRSVDGAIFGRVDFPEVIDLTSVRATDELRATVETRGGRTFTTTDGGHTWNRD
jgi:hypothetical protein